MLSPIYDTCNVKIVKKLLIAVLNVRDNNHLARCFGRIIQGVIVSWSRLACRSCALEDMLTVHARAQSWSARA